MVSGIRRSLGIAPGEGVMYNFVWDGVGIVGGPADEVFRFHVPG
jgi:hypothetical protein